MKDLKSLKNEIIEEGYNFTENPMEALYILSDGTMISGDFDCGIRGTDHRMIDSVVEGSDRYDESKFWDIVHYDLQLVRTVPETKIALIGTKQVLTADQKRIISDAGYKIEKY
ncbi:MULTISPECIES: hypothetical protein [Bacillus amyloliquefaciens group]|uniref:hypothetical protein n=1 Tax=Bacillus amyloliquefaciens group TaxID=1938374 RepID=UPI00226DF08D|nr:hypothetical protein [Bacillus velezensis]MCY0092269.1 hypothetical protein [Bacillus velezensis]